MCLSAPFGPLCLLESASPGKGMPSRTNRWPPAQPICPYHPTGFVGLLLRNPKGGSSYFVLAAVLQNPSPQDLYLLDRPVLSIRLNEAQPAHDAHTALDAPKDGMFAVEPRRGREGDEELAAVRVGPGVGHGQDAGAGVLELRRLGGGGGGGGWYQGDLVLEFLAVDGGAAAAGAGRVAALDHEGGDDAVEGRRVVVPALGEGEEVGAGLGGVRGVQFEGDGALLLLVAPRARHQGWERREGRRVSI